MQDTTSSSKAEHVLLRWHGSARPIAKRLQVSRLLENLHVTPIFYAYAIGLYVNNSMNCNLRLLTTDKRNYIVIRHSFIIVL
jgi:hypothetical protein